MKKIFKVMIAMGSVMALSFLTTSCFFFKVDDDEAVNTDDMKLVWSDEFDYTGVPNTSKWKYQTGKHGWGNNELQNYIDNTSSYHIPLIHLFRIVGVMAKSWATFSRECLPILFITR